MLHSSRYQSITIWYSYHFLVEEKRGFGLIAFIPHSINGFGSPDCVFVFDSEGAVHEKIICAEFMEKGRILAAGGVMTFSAVRL
jgi:hypothetical protein